MFHSNHNPVSSGLLKLPRINLGCKSTADSGAVLLYCSLLSMFLFAVFSFKSGNWKEKNILYCGSEECNKLLCPGSLQGILSSL